MLFNKNDIGVNSNNQEADSNESAFTSKFLNMHTANVENLKRDLERLPENGEAFFLQSMKQFNAITFLLRIAEDHFIEELHATTYSVSMRVIEALQELHNKGRIGRINLLISDSMRNRNPKVCDAINSWAESNSLITIIYTWNHSKFTLCKTETSYYDIEGSGNWGDNACYEQYCFVNSKTVYEKRKELFSNCKVVYKIN
ncbi:MAG: hypothetical protein WCJ72_08620 [Chryseobacterium sp.]